MIDPWLQQLRDWQNFYMLSGTAAATLTGLMFVVISLSPNMTDPDAEANVRAFVTPTVVQLSVVLVLLVGITRDTVLTPAQLDHIAKQAMSGNA